MSPRRYPGRLPQFEDFRTLRLLTLLAAAVAGRATLPTLASLLDVGRPLPGTALPVTSISNIISSGFSLLAVIAALLLLTVRGEHWSFAVMLWSAYMVAGAFSNLANESLTLTTAMVSTLTASSLIFLRVDYDRALSALTRVFLGIVIVALATAILSPSIARYGSGSDWLSRNSRLAGPFATPNELANVAALCLILLAAGAFQNRTWRLAAALPSLAVLLLTQSYTGWIACTVGSIVAAASRPYRRVTVRQAMVASMVLALFAVMTIPRVQQTGTINDPSGRRLVWEYAYSHWDEKALLGHGTDEWRRLILSQEIPVWAVHAHNQWLNTIFVGGLVGLLLLVVATAVTAVKAFNQWKQGYTAALACLLAELIRSYTEAPLELLQGGLNLVAILTIISLSQTSRQSLPAAAFTSSRQENSPRPPGVFRA